MKNMLCFLFWYMVAYTIFFLSPRWELYALENWGIRAFPLAIYLKSYVVMLIGYFAFKPIFEGGNEKLDFVNYRFSMDNLFVVGRFRNGERNSEQRRYFRYSPYLLAIDKGE